MYTNLYRLFLLLLFTLIFFTLYFRRRRSDSSGKIHTKTWRDCVRESCRHCMDRFGDCIHQEMGQYSYSGAGRTALPARSQKLGDNSYSETSPGQCHLQKLRPKDVGYNARKREEEIAKDEYTADNRNGRNLDRDLTLSHRIGRYPMRWRNQLYFCLEDISFDLKWMN